MESNLSSCFAEHDQSSRSALSSRASSFCIHHDKHVHAALLCLLNPVLNRSSIPWKDMQTALPWASFARFSGIL
jgi:hypothetical protein